ncbi:hypothetical protein [uncultured Capnocytophaga sp.]|jgi:hypothetical protein|uniref:hypothetical protein n=1 Tax=uncultured Capnocytophaga sp. TaxID=159273 RepID=UPI0025955AA7|nr:hypothetical protein [uncultured Capnocytophaga sp.]
MAYVDNNATAWGEIEFKFGAPGAGGAMGTVLKTLGIVKEGSYSIEKEDGKEYKYTAIGGKVIDQMKGEPTYKFKCTVKNFSKALLSEIWDIEEVGDKLVMKSFVSKKKFSVSIIPKVSGAEKVDIFYCSMTGTLTYDEESGYNIDIEITPIDGGKGYFSIEKVA